MTKRTSLAVISAITVIACLFTLFAGISGYNKCKDSIKDEKKHLDSLTELVDKFDEASTLLKKDADKYAALQSEYDKVSAEYNAKLEQHDADVKAYEEGVVKYNQDLMSYSVGKNALGSASMLGEGKAQLSSGWDAYNQGLAAYEEGLTQFNQGREQYNQLMEGIQSMESKGMPHFLVLQIISAQAGTNINDSKIAEMKAGIDEGQAQLDQAKAQLDAAYAQLSEGQAQLDQAEQQIAKGKAEINAIGSNLPSSREELDTASANIDEAEESLGKMKTELDKKEEALKVYKDSEETVKRSVSKLVDMGIVKENSSAKKALKLAHREEDSLSKSYNLKAAAFSLGLALLLIDIFIAVLAMKNIANPNNKRAIRYAATSTAISVILCILGTLRSLGSLAISLLLLMFCTIVMIRAIKRDEAQETE